MLKLFNPWHKPTVLDAIEHELYEAEHQLQQHQTQLEYYKNLVAFNRERIQRLTIQRQTRENPQ